MEFQTPILLIFFNRPWHANQVLDSIANLKPQNLYVFQDGARVDNEHDIEKCSEVRRIIEKRIDWKCNLKTFYSEKNLGCGPGPAKAITWFFDQVEMGIVLEDDAIASNDFFHYAEELLVKFKDNSKVRAIGSMKVDQKEYGDASYYFSMMNRTLCAWATWKRAWIDFDYHLESLTKKDLFRALSNYGVTYKEKEYWYERLLEIQKDGLGNSSWDQQFWISIWINNGMGICPNKNLSSNIGFDSEATHTKNENNVASRLMMESILPLTHPLLFNISRKADLNFHKLYFSPGEYGIEGFKRLPFRVNKRIKRLFGHKGSWFK